MSDFLRQLPGSSQRSRWARYLHVDQPLLTLLALFCLLSLLVLYSAGGESLDTVLRQAVRMLMGFAVMLVLANIPPRTLRFWSPWIFLGGLALLFAVMFFGEISKGAQRWLDIPGLGRFQPSEIMKLSLPMMLAWFFQKYELSLRWWHYLIAAAIMLVPVGLVLKQPDLGTAILIAAAGFFVIFFAGLPWKVILGLAR